MSGVWPQYRDGRCRLHNVDMAIFGGVANCRATKAVAIVRVDVAAREQRANNVRLTVCCSPRQRRSTVDTPDARVNFSATIAAVVAVYEQQRYNGHIST